jgi:hypothetical protein
VEVHKTRQHQQPVGFDHVVGVVIGDMLFNGDNPAAGNRDVALGVEILGWIYNGPVLDNKIVSQKTLSD